MNLNKLPKKQHKELCVDTSIFKNESNRYLEYKFGHEKYQEFVHYYKAGLNNSEIAKLMKWHRKRANFYCNNSYKFKKYTLLNNRVCKWDYLTGDDKKIINSFIKNNKRRDLNKILYYINIPLDSTEISRLMNWSYKKARYWINNMPKYYINDDNKKRSFLKIKI